MNDLVAVTGNLTLGGTTDISVAPFPGAALSSGTYTLFTYGGSLSGFTPSSLALANPGVLTTRQNYQFTSDGSGVYLDITGIGAHLTWAAPTALRGTTPAASPGPTTARRCPDQFVTGDYVTFSAANAGTVTINGTRWPPARSP